jgi:hypothetical protein
VRKKTVNDFSILFQILMVWFEMVSGKLANLVKLIAEAENIKSAIFPNDYLTPAPDFNGCPPLPTPVPPRFAARPIMPGTDRC